MSNGLINMAYSNNVAFQSLDEIETLILSDNLPRPLKLGNLWMLI